MQTDSKSRSGTLILAFLAVYVVWGSTYLAMRFGVESVPPLLLAGTRFLTAGVLLVGLWLAVLQARTVAGVRDAQHGHAVPRRRSRPVDWRVFDRGSQPVSRLRHLDAVLARGGVLDRIRLGDRIYRVHLHFKEQHGGARGDLCVRESGCGAPARLDVCGRSVDAANSCSRCGDSRGGRAGDYGAASRARAEDRADGPSKRSVSRAERTNFGDPQLSTLTRHSG